METEYSLRMHRNSKAMRSFDFVSFADQLRREMPCVPSFRNPERLFLANGGSVSLERGAAYAADEFLLETATPECQSPKELLSYQLAMERLVVESVGRCMGANQAQLMKGNTDSRGHTYGQHESYEVRVAKGWRLFAWRLGLLLLLPWIMGYQLIASIWIVSLWLLGMIYCQVVRVGKMLGGLVKGRSPGKSSTHSTEPKERTADSIHIWTLHPRWIEFCALGLRLFHLPIACGLWINIQLFALIPHRRYLSSFFASRCILDGAGYLDQSNRFWVSVRAASVNSMIGFGSYRKERPIFRCDTWLRDLCIEPLWRPQRFMTLFRSHQRIEIAIGDSGLCQQSQYVRVGATALVLDMVEKAPTNVPQLQNYLEAIRKFSKDWMLLASVSDRSRRQWTALDIQHAYAAEVRHFLQDQLSVPIEAWKILDAWQTTLNQMRPTDDESELPRNMLGRIDWMSKLWLLHQMRAETTWQVRKKIDLRYHELSKEGYHDRLQTMLEIAPLIDEHAIGRARRSPPHGTPATQRGYLIREFADSDSGMHCDWTHAEFRFDGRKRIARF